MTTSDVKINPDQRHKITVDPLPFDTKFLGTFITEWVHRYQPTPDSATLYDIQSEARKQLKRRLFNSSKQLGKVSEDWFSNPTLEVALYLTNLAQPHPSDPLVNYLVLNSPTQHSVVS